MGETEVSLERLGNAFRECAGYLRADRAPTNDNLRRIHPLRILQQELRRVLEEGGEDRLARTVAFLVDAWIRDYFLNFAGDVLSPASLAVDEIRKRLIQGQVVDAFEKLGAGLTGDSSEIIEAQVMLVCSYLEAISESREKVGGW